GDELEQHAEVSIGHRHELARARQPARRCVELEASEGVYGGSAPRIRLYRRLFVLGTWFLVLGPSIGSLVRPWSMVPGPLRLWSKDEGTTDGPGTKNGQKTKAQAPRPCWPCPVSPLRPRQAASALSPDCVIAHLPRTSDLGRAS